MKYIAFISYILLAAYIILKTSELFLSENKQESFRQTLQDITSEISLKGADWTALSPLYYMSSFLEKYLGKRLISRRSISLASITTAILVVSSIWLSSLATNSVDFLEKSPLKIWDQSIDFLKSPVMEKDLGTGIPENLGKDKKYLLKVKERRECLYKLDGFGGRYLFAIILLSACMMTIIVLSSLTLAITRKVLREMIHSKGVITLIGGAIVNFILIILLSSFFGVLLYFISYPSWWTMWDGVISLMTRYSVWSLVVYFAASILAALSLPVWIKLVVLISLSPIILIAFSLMLSAIIFFFRKPIHLTVINLVRRALEWKAGPIAFLAGLLGLLASFFTLLSKCLV
jgi:hypothetical protein